MSRVKTLIGRNTRRARKRLGLLQSDIAEGCGVSDGFISEIEHGRKYPSAEVLECIAGTLGLQPYQLLLDEEDWEIRDRLETVTDMYRELKERVNSVLDDALRRHSR